MQPTAPYSAGERAFLRWLVRAVIAQRREEAKKAA